MLRIVNLEEIQSFLLRVPALVDRLERKENRFPEGVKGWLKEVETALENNRMAVVGDIAALRGMLVMAERGVVPSGLNIPGRPSGRRIREAASETVIRRAQELVSGAIMQDRLRIAGAERAGRQVVAVAIAKGMIPVIPSGEDRTKELKSVWGKICSDPDLGGAAVSLLGMVGPEDALILLDRAIAFHRTADSAG